MCTFSAYLAFNKATNGQTDIKQETDENLAQCQLIVLRSFLPHWHWNKFSSFYTRLSICRFVNGNIIICRQFALRFSLVQIKKRSYVTSCVFGFAFSYVWSIAVVEWPWKSMSAVIEFLLFIVGTIVFFLTMYHCKVPRTVYNGTCA